MSREVGKLALMLLALLAAGSTGCGKDSRQSEQGQRLLHLMGQAWGPESPETLQNYLEVRQALLPVYKQSEEALQQHSLREVSTRPLLMGAIKGLLEMRREADTQLAARNLDIEDYQRLTILVYGRWLRSVRREEPPEKRVTRLLQELEVAVSRRLQNNPPEGERERSGEEDRLASIRHQLRFVAPYGLIDKKATLERLDAGTKAWLEQHRAEIEACDFKLFDTAAPERLRPVLPKPTGEPPPPPDESLPETAPSPQ